MAPHPFALIWYFLLQKNSVPHSTKHLVPPTENFFLELDALGYAAGYVAHSANREVLQKGKGKLSLSLSWRNGCSR